jgi:hypothetical protein
MSRTRVAAVGLGLAIAAISLNPRSAAGQFQITASPSVGTTMAVQAGGPPLGVSLSGSDASRVDSVSVRRGGAVATNVTASLAASGRLSTTTSRQASVIADQNAKPASDYELLAWAGHGYAVVTTFEVLSPLPVPASVAISPASVVAGSPASGTVTLNRVAPSGGTPVFLAVNDLTAASVPSKVTVPAGQTGTTFQVSTKVIETERSVTVNATAGDQSRSAVLQVLPPPLPVLTAMTLAVGQVVGGFPAMGTVTVDRAAPPSGAIVSLSVSDGAAASVPATVTVAKGQTSASFQVATQRTEQQRSVTVEASASGQSRSAALQLLPYVPVVSALMLSKTQATGGETVPASIRLASPPPAGGASIPLRLGTASSIPTRLTPRAGDVTALSPIMSTPKTIQPPLSASPVTIPPSVTVAAGQLEASFSVQTKPDSVDRQATISAGTAPNDASATLQVVSAQERRLVEVRVEGPDHVDEGGSASYRAIAVFDNGATADVTDDVFSWQVNSGVGATIQKGVLSAPAQVAAPAQAVVQAGWGMPDERLFFGSRQVTIRTWTVEIQGPDEVMESDFDSHLQSGAVHYNAVVVEPDGSRAPVSGGSWSFPTSMWFSANLLPDGTFGVYAATRDEPTEIRARITRNGVQKWGIKPVAIRYLPVKLESLRIVNGPMSLDLGASIQLRAEAKFRGASATIVNANWALASSPPGTSINPTTGLLAVGPTAGDVRVTATYERSPIIKTASWAFVVATVTTMLDRVEILTPQPNTTWPPYMWEGTDRQYQARAHFMDGSKQIIQPEWSVSGSATQISPSGFLTTADIDADAPVTVMASYTWNGVTKTATDNVLIRAFYPTSCELESGRSTTVNIPWDGSYQFRLSVTFIDGSTQLMTGGVSWSATGTWKADNLDHPALAQPPAVSITPAGLLSVPPWPVTSAKIIGNVTASFTTGGHTCTASGSYAVPFR